eukprot:TRINITY_DN6449_c1_g1_i1.p1 TRINITY_DN6449_c1_g1~~TRINITY_DN6449_c1_g1_i1.p1  ORF type:complete len:287 (+),score=58.14 TRINITY_DN6449_c1_g1_i1:4-864(+)
MSSESDKETFKGNVERFTGFAELYDRVRPAAPQDLHTIAALYTMHDHQHQQQQQQQHLGCVVDLGCGTGLSTRYWAGKAAKCIGVDPTVSMRAQAETMLSTVSGATTTTFELVSGYGHATGLPDQCADVVTIGQALHWMEPAKTFAEIRRILKKGGLLMVYDFNYPPSIGYPEAERAYEECNECMKKYEESRGVNGIVRRWNREQHLERMKESKQFSYCKEIHVSHVEQGTGNRLLDLFLSMGGTQTLLKMGVTEEELKIPQLRELVKDIPQTTFFWSCSIKIGVK